MKAKAQSDAGSCFFVLRLFIAGNEPNSRLAKENLRRFCSEYLADQASVELIDVLVDHSAAMKDGVFVTPTLKVIQPSPQMTVYGNLSDQHRLAAALGIERSAP